MNEPNAAKLTRQNVEMDNNPKRITTTIQESLMAKKRNSSQVSRVHFSVTEYRKTPNQEATEGGCRKGLAVLLNDDLGFRRSLTAKNFHLNIKKQSFYLNYATLFNYFNLRKRKWETMYNLKNSLITKQLMQYFI